MRITFVLLLIVLLAGGCSSSDPAKTVVVYTALDQEFSQPILESFEQSTGIKALAKFDVESTKTVGLTQAILAEASRPRCDVFWNNEILNTLRLERQGLLLPYTPPAASAIPAMWKSPDGTWHAFAARARVILVNKSLVAEADRPKSIYDLAEPRWRGKIGIAKPLFGTTATQAACLFAYLSPDKAKEYFHSLKANDVRIMAGNRHVAQAVAAGQLAFGLTDTDDALVELENGQPVAIVYPDSAADQIGTLFIPNTLSIVRGAPHEAAAKQLVEFLLQPDVEARLAAGPSAQIPLNPLVKAELRVETPATIHAMPVDFYQAVDQWDAAARFLRDEFTAD